MCVCAHCHMCVCVLSFVSSQLNLANLPPPPTAILHIPLSPSLLFLLIPLSDEQIELLNELFLWAPNAHLQLSICSFPPSVRLSLPPSTHPSILLPPPPPPTTFLSPESSCCNNVYIYRRWSTHTHTCSQSPIQRSDVCAPHLLPTADFRSWEKNCVRLWMFMCTCFQGKTKKITFKIPLFNTVSPLNYYQFTIKALSDL